MFLDGGGQILRTGDVQLRVEDSAAVCIYNLNLIDGSVRREYSDKLQLLEWQSARELLHERSDDSSATEWLQVGWMPGEIISGTNAAMYTHACTHVYKHECTMSIYMCV